MPECWLQLVVGAPNLDVLSTKRSPLKPTNIHHLLQPTFECGNLSALKHMSVGPHDHLPPTFRSSDLFAIKHLGIGSHNQLQSTSRHNDLFWHIYLGFHKHLPTLLIITFLN